jgi:hypothetical protein
MAFQESNRTSAAVMMAAFTVSLLCLYVSAYARVTAEGFDLGRVKEQLRAASVVHEALQAQVSQLTLPAAVGERASALGMEKVSPDSITLLASDGSSVAAPSGGNGDAATKTSELPIVTGPVSTPAQ